MYYITQYNYNGHPRLGYRAGWRASANCWRRWFPGCRSISGGLFNTDPRKADVLSDVMAGAAPIRMDTSDFGKAG